MYKTVVAVTALLVSSAGIGSAHAEHWGSRWGWGGGATYTPRIDANEAQQRMRIEDGRRSGQLTHREYARLMAEQDRIASMERRAKADGIATWEERRIIRQAQEDASRHIYKEKSDGESRWNNWYRRWR